MKLDLKSIRLTDKEIDDISDTELSDEEWWIAVLDAQIGKTLKEVEVLIHESELPGRTLMRQFLLCEALDAGINMK